MRCVIYKCHSFLYFGTNGAPYIAVCITSIIILLSHLLHLFDTCQLSVLDSSILPYICLTMSMDVALLSNPNMQYGYMDMHVLSENFVISTYDKHSLVPSPTPNFSSLAVR